MDKLEQKLGAIDSLVLKEDLEKFLKFIAEFMTSLKKANAETREAFRIMLQSATNKMVIDKDTEIGEMKKMAMKYCIEEMSKIIKEHEKMKVDLNVEKIGIKEECLQDNALVAKTASDLAITAILPTLPTVDSLLESLPTQGAAVASALELLPDGEKLNIDAIQDLRDELDEIKTLAKKKGFGNVVFPGGGTGSSAGKIVKSYDLSGQLNGVLKTFTIPAFWRIISISSSSFPNAFRENVDFTTDTSAASITFTSAIEASTTLATGQTITVIYSEP